MWYGSRVAMALRFTAGGIDFIIPGSKFYLNHRHETHSEDRNDSLKRIAAVVCGKNLTVS